MTRPKASLLILVLLGGVYGYRALIGVTAGIAFSGGEAALREGWHDSRHETAALRFDHAAVGGNHVRALRKSAEGRLDRWSAQAREDGPMASDVRWLEEAATAYVRALVASPASRRPWEGLGRVYDRMEERARHIRMQGPREAGEDPWRRVGDSGRVAVGMLREAIDREPNWYSSHDRLGMMLWEYGVGDAAERQIRLSAQVLPLFSRHLRLDRADLPPALLDAFAEGAWSVFGRVRLMSERTHLVSLARVETRRGAQGRAIAALRGARARPGDRLNQAEVDFLLGVAYLAADEDLAAHPYFEASLAHPVFRTGSLINLARIEEHAGRMERALERWKAVRWENPDNVEYCLAYARLARGLEQWSGALETLRWAVTLAPADPRPRREIIEIYVAMGDRDAAYREIDALRSDPVEGLDPAVLRRGVDARLSR